MNNKKLFLVRTAIIAFYAVCIIFTVIILVKNPFTNNIYGVLSHDKSLFHCPTCGFTRAVYCLFTLQLKKAFYYHAFFITLFPVLLYLVLTLSVNLFFNKKILPYPKKYSIYLYVLFGLLIAFTVLRNFTSVIY